MKNTKYIIGTLFTAILALTGCVKEEDGGSKALLLSDNTITFEAVEAPEQTISVYADADWTAVCDLDWISLDLTSGTGNTPVMIRVADNVDAEGTLQLPREGEVSFYGRSESIVATLTVKQLGDTYLGAKEMTVSEAVAAEDGTPMGLKESQVLAVCGHGFVVSDGVKSLYVKGESSVKIGDKITVKGIKDTEDSVPVLDDVENVTVNSSAEVVNGTAKDLATAESVEVFDYLLLDGTLVGSSIVAGSITADICASSEDLSEFNAHYVKAYAYYVGSFGYILVSDIEDKGVNEDVKLPVEWNVNEVKDNGLSSRATEGDDENWVNKGILNPISGFGYIQYVMSDDYPLEGSGGTRVRDVEAGNPRVSGAWIGDYWEFASYVPAQAGDIIKLEFEGRISSAGLRYWRMQYLDGTEWKDVSKPNTVIDVKGNEVIYTHDFADGDGSNVNHIYSNAVQYVNATNMIVFRMTCVSAVRGNNAEPLTKPSTASMRLDADAPVHPKISVGQISDLPNDNVANVEVTVDKSLTFEAVPTSSKTFTIMSDNEAEVTKDDDWIIFLDAEGSPVDKIVIPAGEQTIVSVTCLENVDPSTREGIITITSGATVETIKVTQVSPGVSLEPFVSLVGGNSGNVNFEDGSFNLAVQTNVDFEISSDAAWVNIQAVPETRALVEIKQFVVAYEANADSQERVAHIRVFNADNNIETVYTLTQAGFESGVYFQEDFTWVAPWADAYGSADSVGENDEAGKAPNVYTQKSHLAYDGVGFVNGGAGVEGYPSFLEAFVQRGYEDLNPAGQVIYTQKYYLKFGKTNVHTGIKLPANEFEGIYPTNVDLTFDWAAHMLGDDKGNVLDDVQIVVELEGPGVCAGSGEKVSTALVTSQVDGQLAWQKASIVLMGVTKDTRISIRPLKMSEATPKTQRWYIDNIKLAKSDVPVKFFEETWDWVAPWADAYGSGDSVGDNDHSGKAPNVYTQKSHLAYDGVGYADGGAGVEGYPSFLEAFAERGYTDLNPAGQVMYTQKYYMKFGKTNVHTGITLPSNEFMGDKPVDVEVSFNWCAHMITKEPYTFDKVQMVIEITGPGTCADSNSKVSNAYDTHQQNGLMEWQDFSVRVNGVTKDTKITIRPLNWDKTDKDGADYKVQRYHLDNILIQSAR